MADLFWSGSRLTDVSSPAETVPVETVPVQTVPAQPMTGEIPADVRWYLVSVVERLYGNYDDCLPLSTIIEVVRGCLADIQGAPVAALPELAERLARQRLIDLLAEIPTRATSTSRPGR
jgi:hypothetical protein